MQQPFFSIIIPLYNRAHLIERAVNSVIDQTFTDWELIIVDDCSTDGSWKLINTFQDKRINVLRNDTNSERCISRNNGIKASTGQYICFLDSDDYHLPHHLDFIFNRISNEPTPPKGFFFTNAWNESPKGIRKERNCPDFTKHDPYVYFLRYTVNPQRWAVHRDVMLTHLFDPEVTICEDMDTSLRMVAANTPVYQLYERTTVYVGEEDSFTHGDANKWEKELFYLERIFNKPALEGHLPSKEKNRLRSMCHYHISVKAFENQRSAKVMKHGILSFLLFPAGYNNKTNFSLLVILIYSLPMIGSLVKWLVKMRKR